MRGCPDQVSLGGGGGGGGGQVGHIPPLETLPPWESHKIHLEGSLLSSFQGVLVKDIFQT